MRLPGLGGEDYEFDVHPLKCVDAPSEPGVYVVARLEIGRWHLLFLDETRNILEETSKLDRHPLGDMLRTAGATHVGTLVASGPQAHRMSIERDIRLRHRTWLNISKVSLRRCGEA